MLMSSLFWFCWCAIVATGIASTVESRQREHYTLRVESVTDQINGQRLSLRNSTLGLFPDSEPVVVSPVPSSSDPDLVSLYIISNLDVVRVIALDGSNGVYDMFDVGLPSDSDERSWEDWKIVEHGDERALTWASAKRDSNSWLAMPVRSGQDGYWVWFVDDFEGGFGGVILPIDNIVLEKLY